eukprot:Tbor_TRINITY_DN5348_c0_g3::TRINITY_DN5348_c0_g3_i1::g.4815::m.4815
MTEFIQDIWDQIVAAHHEVIGQFPLNIFDELNNNSNTPGIMDAIRSFINAVDWYGEPFFKYLLAFHILHICVTFIWGFRTVYRTLTCLMMYIILGLLCGPLNYLGDRFAKDIFIGKNVNYFDTNGAFITAVLAGPICVVAFICQFKVLVDLGKMLVAVKVRQLKQQQADQKKSNGKNNKINEKRVRSGGKAKKE